ncbi:hypothetical protein [Streptomyces canarius]
MYLEKKYEKVSFELAVYSLGMMQSVLRTMISATGQYGNPETVIRTILKNIEYLAPHIAKQGSLITSEMSQALLNKIEDKPVTKDMIIEQLKGFIKNLPDDDLKRGHELAQFLLEELESQKESDAIFEVVLSAFNRSFTNTSHEAEAHQISIYIWRYLDLN